MTLAQELQLQLQKCVVLITSLNVAYIEENGTRHADLDTLQNTVQEVCYKSRFLEDSQFAQLKDS